MVMALRLLQTCRGINTRGYSVISIRMISDVKGRKITLLKLEKSRDESHRLLCSVARYLSED